MSDEPPQTAPRRIWTRSYLLLCAAHFLIYAHEGVLIPALPLYITALGGSEVVVGLVITAYAAASFMLRPLLGYWTDRWNAYGVMLVGALLLAGGGLALLIPIVWLIGLANAVRGIGWGAANVAGNTVLAQLAPISRRGEASSYFTLFQLAAMYAFPLVGVWLLAVRPTSYSAPIVFAALCALGAIAVAAIIPRVPGAANGKRARPPGMADLLDRPMLLPAALVVSWMLSQPAIMAYAPLYARDLGVPVEALSIYYVASGGTAIVVRLGISPLADRLGYGLTLLTGYTSNTVGLLVLAMAPGLEWMVAGAILSALGPALNVPAATALAIERADPRRQGVAMASFTMAFQAGPAIGGVLWGATIALAGYRAMYLIAAMTVALGLALTLFKWRTLSRPSSRERSAPAVRTASRRPT